jgi:hypothetical protein
MFYVRFNHFRAVKFSVKRVFDPGHGYLRVRGGFRSRGSIDAVLAEEGLLKQLAEKKTYWPDTTFERLEYPTKPNRPSIESGLADYWDILLIAKRTEVVGTLIYYPFVILSLCLWPSWSTLVT